MNKKADSLFAGVLIAIIVVTLAFPVAKYITLTKESKFEWEIGESQLLLLNTYEKGEKVLFYIDQAGKIALDKAYLEIVNFDSNCGNFRGYPKLNTKNKECYPELKETIKKGFSTEFENQLNEFPEDIPDLGYEYYVVENQLVARSKNNLRMDISEEDTYNFKADKLSFKNEIDTPGDYTEEDYSSEDDLELLGECSYCYKNNWREYWGKLLEFWDPEASSRCTDKCCKAKCPTNSKILDVDYINQCDEEFGQHKDAIPETYGYGEYDACMAMCGPTAMQMVNDYYQGSYNYKLEWSSLKSGPFDWYGGAYRTSMPNLLKQKTGYDFQITTIYDTKFLRDNIDEGKPIITGLALPKTGCPESSPFTYYCFNSMGHIFTVVGYAPGYIIINDPYTNSKGGDRWVGENLVIPESGFRNIWRKESIYLK